MQIGLGIGIGFPRGRGASAAPYDPDAAAYFAYAGITDETFMNAYNAWVVGAKAAGLYQKHDVLSVFTTPTQAEALFNTLQDDFHPSLANTPIFTSGEGFNGNSSNSGLMWDWNPTIDAVNYSQNSAHIYAWCLTDSQENGCDFGTNANGPFTGGNIRNASGNAQWQATGNSTNTTATASSLGLFGMNRTGSAGSASNLWRNGAKVANGASTSTALFSGNLYLSAVPGFGATSRKFALLGVTSGLSDAEQEDLYDLWLAFMQAMGLV